MELFFRCQGYRSGVFIVNFEHILHLAVLFLLLTLIKLMQTGETWQTSKMELFVKIVNDHQLFLQKAPS